MVTIPKDVALKLCAEIRDENIGKWYSFARWQCWGCQKFSKGEPEKSCLGGEGGCNLINARYDSMMKK